MYSRNLWDKIDQKMAASPILLLLGPRQCGKTTLVKKIGEDSGIPYISFDDISTLAAVQFDPAGFLRAQPKPLIVDEAQRAPELFLPIKVDVDGHRNAGRYLLTGSANPLMVPHLSDALTGRMSICHLWPFSQGELFGVKETFVDQLFNKNTWQGEYPALGQEELLRRLSLGGFPAMHTASSVEQQSDWCNDYLFSTLQKDINELSKIERFSQMPALLYGLSSRVGSTLNMEELSRLTGTSSSTIKRYLQLLESLFLLYRLPAWHRNIDKRIVKSPKLHFTDTALLMHTFGIDRKRLESLPQIFGHILENFLVMEIVKQATWSTQNPMFSHFRQEDDGGSEVHLVLETRSGKLVGIEIKSAEIVRKDDLKGLIALQKQAEDLFYQGIILYTGNKVLPFGEHFFAVPISALWSEG